VIPFLDEVVMILSSKFALQEAAHDRVALFTIFFLTCMLVNSDCECDSGYFKNRGRCAANPNLCSEESFERIEGKQAEVYGWLDQAKEMNSYDDKVYCIGKMNDALNDVWLDYNKVKAACEEIDDDGQRRLLFDGKLLDKALNAIKDVGKKALDFVVDLVDDTKCFLVGGAFDILGGSIDILLTVGTGGSTQLSKAVCVAGKALNKSSRLLTNTVKGISSMICSLNRKIDSDVLDEVCKFEGDIDSVSNRRVKRFAETFQSAVCGQPGKALGNILEDLVDCEIDCASKSNLFCGN